VKLAVFTSKYPARIATSDVAGIPDALRDGCGVLVPPRDPVALATALKRLLSDPAEQRAIAVRARRRTEEKYDLWRNGARLAHLLRSTRRGAPQVVPAVPELGYASPV